MKLSNVKVSRWSGTALSNDMVEIHLLTDASEKAYGCLYMKTSKGSQSLYPKTKLAPLKVQTPAGLELHTAFLGSRVLSLVSEQLSITMSSVSALTGSTNVWHWLQ